MSETSKRSSIIDTNLRALREIYWLLREGEADNALHALDAYLIGQGVNPEDYAGVVVLPLASNQDSRQEDA